MRESNLAPPPRPLDGLRSPYRWLRASGGRELAGRTFGITLVLVAVTGAFLATTSTHAGTPDSISNLDTARNIALGRGFTTDIVQQLASPQVVPGPDVVRPPALPYLLAALAPLVGVGPAGAVILNVLAILATALLVRAALRSLHEPLLGDLAGLVVLSTHAAYTVLEALNNNVLVALTAAMLLLTVLALGGRLRGARLAVAAGALSGIGFLVKQTFMLGAVALAVFLLARDRERTRSQRLRDTLLFLILFIALCSPYLLRNILLFGDPLYAPANALRLPVHYGIPGYDWHNRVLLFGSRGFSYRDIAEQIGLGGMLRREASLHALAVANVVRLNPIVLPLAAVLLLLAPRRRRAAYIAIGLLLIMPYFDGLYWYPEPRYMWPAFPALLLLVGVAAAELRTIPPGHFAGWRSRRVLGAVHVAMVAAIALGAGRGVPLWREEVGDRHWSPPAWTPLVRSLPANARILSASPYLPAWYGERPSIVAPLGGRSSLDRVLSYYRPTYFLESTTLRPAERVAFRPEELQLLAQGPGWRLHRIVAPASPGFGP